MINFIFSRLTITKSISILIVMLSLVCLPSNAQTFTKVTGTIVDDNGEPLIGANVYKLGTKVVVTSDFDGQYVIKAKSGDILKFAYLGFEDKTITITSATQNITLNSNVENLNDVVLIGYGSVKKKELTGAVARVEAEELERITTSDLGTALQGQVSGVNVVAPSTPGGESEILIRGITSINGDNTPLYVVDGIIQDGDPRIPPSEVESLDILKDAASTAIYGARGAAGVILITTKKGEEGTLKVRVNGSSAIQLRRPAVPLLNATEQLFVNTVSFRNTTGDVDANLRLPTLQNPYALQNDTDLNKLLFNDQAYIHNYNTSVSGGNKELTYNVTMGIFNQKGLQLNSNYERFNTRSNTTYKKGKLSVGTSVGLSIDKRDIPRNNLLSQAIVYSPNQNGLVLDDFNDLVDNGDQANRLTWVIQSLKTKEYLKTLRSNASINLNYDVNKNISLRANSGVTYNIGRGKIKVPYQEVINRTTGQPITQPTNSYIEDRSNERINFYAEIGGNIKKQFDDHKLDLGIFITAEKTSFEQFNARRLEAINNDLDVLNSATGEQIVNSGNDYTSTMFSQLARLQYNYKGKYNLSSSVRFDRTSKYAYNNNFGMFPSLAFAWNVSDEEFWNNFKDTVNNFKFRITHGTVGNNRIQDYQYIATITQNIDYVGATGTSEVLNNGATQTDFKNPNLKWETSVQTNVGVDLAFLKNKITFGANYYSTHKRDMLFPVFLPTSAGGGNNATVILNAGNMTNKGIELSTRYRNRIGKVWYQMTGTFTTNQNKITKINGDNDFLFTNDNGLVSRAQTQSRVTAHQVGREAGAFYLWRTNGIINTEEKLAEYQTIDSNAKMGDVMFIDQNNDKQLDDNDRVYSGSGLPKYEIGYNVNATYKDFDFSMNWYASLGHEIMNGFNAWAYGFGRHKDLIYQWSEANPVTNVPAFRDDIRNHRNFIGYSDLWLEDGSYLRLRQVTLGYSLPKKTTKKLGIERLRFYISSQNPLTFTNYKGYNPEVGGGVTAKGLDKGTGPISVQYLAGINFNF
ncbi:SusC/RagA family TonB-linked outer membrane protein [Wenyingzhuangia aestuarii]|uniref:SusC/RagA family TonB-linked outer membrane protein n=1 Tax=Wenyingzhuangia aestuarii TaxID=1647582 RepID=UPI001FD84888|nr:SusC/RagA family TonB-linked outer membrane protein [Wenyingzhuangia aestuarii]NJB81642.1 TonB-linked SusC/RagA family outer membrane protein [Wenyingzhuangia aestuarii]